MGWKKKGAGTGQKVGEERWRWWQARWSGDGVTTASSPRNGWRRRRQEEAFCASPTEKWGCVEEGESRNRGGGGREKTGWLVRREARRVLAEG